MANLALKVQHDGTLISKSKYKYAESLHSGYCLCKVGQVDANYLHPVLLMTLHKAMCISKWQDKDADRHATNVASLPVLHPVVVKLERA